MSAEKTRGLIYSIESLIEDLERAIRQDENTVDPVKAFCWKAIREKVESIKKGLADTKDIIENKLPAGREGKR